MDPSPSKNLLFVCIALFLGLAAIAGPAFGVEYKKKSSMGSPTALQPPAAFPTRAASHSLTTVFAERGPLALSVNAVGTDLSFGTVEVSKPAGGVLKRAYLAAAATGSYARPFEDGEVRVEGHGVIWDNTIRNGVGSWNAIADVTQYVESKITSSPAGPVLIDYAEDHSDLVDGSVLAVVFEDPGSSPDNYVALYFGAQAVRADSFTVKLPSPVASNLSEARYELGVGISYSLQSNGSSNQYTIISINGRKLTTSAGGPDDGSPSPGALVTVGGIDDSPSNPSDPLAPPVNLTSDDELYDLRPFLTAGDSTIVVKTSSPSEENLFFASMFSSPASSREPSPVASAVSTTPAPVAGPTGPQAVVLSSASSRTPLGSPCEITATVTRDGVPIAGATVELKVVAGPHAGAVSRVQTQDSGTATFLYRGKQSGRDLLVAVLMEGDTAVAGSNAVAHDWAEETLDASIDISPGECPNRVEIGGQDVVTVALAGSQTFDVGDVDITSLSLGSAAPLKIQYRDVTQPVGVDGCSDVGGDGYRDIVMQFRLAEVLPDTAAVAEGAALKWTLTGSTKSGKSFRLTDNVVVAKTQGTPVSVPDDVLSPLHTEVIVEPRR